MIRTTDDSTPFQPAPGCDSTSCFPKDRHVSAGRPFQKSKGALYWASLILSSSNEVTLCNASLRPPALGLASVGPRQYLTSDSFHNMFCKQGVARGSAALVALLLSHAPSGRLTSVVFVGNERYDSEEGRREANHAHFSIPNTIFSLSLWRAMAPFLLCFRTFSSFLLIDLSSSPLISPAFLIVFGKCLCRLILRISGM